MAGSGQCSRDPVWPSITEPSQQQLQTEKGRFHPEEPVKAAKNVTVALNSSAIFRACLRRFQGSAQLRPKVEVEITKTPEKERRQCPRSPYSTEDL